MTEFPAGCYVKTVLLTGSVSDEFGDDFLVSKLSIFLLCDADGASFGAQKSHKRSLAGGSLLGEKIKQFP